MLPTNWFWPVAVIMALFAGIVWGWAGLHGGEADHLPNPDSGLAAPQQERAEREQGQAAQSGR